MLNSAWLAYYQTTSGGGNSRFLTRETYLARTTPLERCFKHHRPTTTNSFAMATLPILIIKITTSKIFWSPESLQIRLLIGGKLTTNCVFFSASRGAFFARILLPYFIWWASAPGCGCFFCEESEVITCLRVQKTTNQDVECVLRVHTSLLSPALHASR